MTSPSGRIEKLYSALAAAARTIFSIALAAESGVNASSINARSTRWPRMTSKTTRALRDGTRRNLAVALSCILFHHRFIAAAAVAAEDPRRRELAELVPDHVLLYVDGDVVAAGVHGDRVPDHGRNDGRRARPGLDHALLPRRIHPLDLLEQ